MSQPRFFSLLIILPGTLLLHACGGGGGGGGGVPPSANTAPVVNNQSLNTDENTPLTVTLDGSDADGDSLAYSVVTDPANGSLTGTAPNLTYTPDADYAGSDSFSVVANDGTEASAEATISITINPLFAIGGTVTGAVSAGLALENNGGDTLDVAGTSFEFPTQLSDGSSYDVTLAGLPEHQLCALANASGTVAAADVNDVSVLCRYWRTEAPIENDSGDASSPQIAIDSAGNAIAVWVQNDGTYDRVWANTYSPDSGWGTAENIGGSTGDAAAPQVVVDSAGVATAVWTQVATYSNLWTNRYTPGSGWATAGFIEHNDGDAASPQIAVDSAGNAIVVWEQNEPPPTPGPTNIWAITYLPGGGWGTAEMIETDGGSAAVPQIAFDSSGNAVAVWHQYDGSSNHNIQANYWSPGSGWETPETIESNDAGSSWDPQIVFDSDDKATVVWSGDDGTRRNIWAISYSAGGGWASEQLIETDNAGTAFSPQIATDSAGNLIAVWRQHDGTKYRSWANSYAPGSGWGTAEIIDIDGGGQQQIAFDSAGNAIAVWRSYSISANTWSPNIGWGTPTEIETDEAGSATNPQIAFDGDGNAIAIWAQDDGTRNNILTNHFE